MHLSAIKSSSLAECNSSSSQHMYDTGCVPQHAAQALHYCTEGDLIMGEACITYLAAYGSVPGSAELIFNILRDITANMGSSKQNITMAAHPRRRDVLSFWRDKRLASSLETPRTTAQVAAAAKHPRRSRPMSDDTSVLRAGVYTCQIRRERTK